MIRHAILFASATVHNFAAYVDMIGPMQPVTWGSTHCHVVACHSKLYCMMHKSLVKSSGRMTSHPIVPLTSERGALKVSHCVHA